MAAGSRWPSIDRSVSSRADCCCLIAVQGIDEGPQLARLDERLAGQSHHPRQALRRHPDYPPRRVERRRRRGNGAAISIAGRPEDAISSISAGPAIATTDARALPLSVSAAESTPAAST